MENLAVGLARTFSWLVFSADGRRLIRQWKQCFALCAAKAPASVLPNKKYDEGEDQAEADR
jgi:hypothetical protein